MIEVDPLLLDTTRGDLTPATEFNATLNAHGLYHGLHFVVRLSPRVHELIASLPNGIARRSDISFEQLQAFSTYLHETIHWWQHVGSTSGLLLSLTYPVQTHANIRHLRQFLAAVGPVKSIETWARNQTGRHELGSPGALANTIINNQFDIEAYRFLVTNPDRAQPLVSSGRFENVGHSYHIALGNNVFSLASTFDTEFKHMPDPRLWEAEIGALRREKREGFYYGSRVVLPPIGTQHIFEGQARFSQLQYLHFATGGQFDWADADEAGMFGELYFKAFEIFLKVSGLDCPQSLHDPRVGLFLLVCDIAINSGEGFPFPITAPALLVDNLDPGIRFLRLANAIREHCPDAAGAITRYDAAEYVHVSELLCAAIEVAAPFKIVTEINRWIDQGELSRACLERHDRGTTDNVNLPLQVLFGQFLSYQRDKASYPHILCWPGPNMAGDAVTEASIGVFSRQSPLFIDRAEDATIVPVLRAGSDESSIMATFQDFYSGHVLYDLTRQWINRKGGFKYDYRWLQPNSTDEQVKEWADRAFHQAYEVWPDDFTLLA